MDAKKIGELRELADRIRITAIEMAYVAGNKGAHLGGSLSSVEIWLCFKNRSDESFMGEKRQNDCWERAWKVV